MSQPTSERRKCLFVLDPLVLHKDPHALFAFGEHNIFISARAIEELERESKLATGKEAVSAAFNMIEQVLQTHHLVEEGRPATSGVDLAQCNAPGGASGKMYLGEYYRSEGRDSSPSAFVHDAIASAKCRLTSRSHFDGDLRFVSDQAAWRILSSAHGVYGLSLDEAKKLVGTYAHIHVLVQA